MILLSNQTAADKGSRSIRSPDDPDGPLAEIRQFALQFVSPTGAAGEDRANGISEMDFAFASVDAIDLTFVQCTVASGAGLAVDGLAIGDRVARHRSAQRVRGLYLQSERVQLDFAPHESPEHPVALRRAELAFQADIGRRVPKR